MEVRRRLLTGSLMLAALLVVACSAPNATPSATAGGPPVPVKFMVANPVINLGHVHLGVAQAQGYYKAANVEVTYLTSPGTVAVVQAIAAGTADMGQADTLSLNAAVAQGVTDVRAVCSYVANNIYYLAVPEDSPIRTAADLKGKKVGLSSLATGVFFNAQVMVKDAGVDPKDVTFVTIAAPGAQLEALRTKQVDALSIIDVTVGTFQNQGQKLRLMQPTGPMRWQWNVVVAKASFLKDRPDAVAGVCRAIQQSELYVKTNPTKALGVFKQWGGDSGGVPDDQAVGVVVSRANAGFTTYEEGKSKWGWLNVDAMDGLADLYFGLGLLEKKVSVKAYYTNELLDKMQFDQDQVKSQAK